MGGFFTPGGFYNPTQPPQGSQDDPTQQAPMTRPDMGGGGFRFGQPPSPSQFQDNSQLAFGMGGGMPPPPSVTAQGGMSPMNQPQSDARPMSQGSPPWMQRMQQMQQARQQMHGPPPGQQMGMGRFGFGQPAMNPQMAAQQAMGGGQQMPSINGGQRPYGPIGTNSQGGQQWAPAQFPGGGGQPLTPSQLAQSYGHPPPQPQQGQGMSEMQQMPQQQFRFGQSAPMSGGMSGGGAWK